MWKLDFFLLPSRNYGSIGEREAWEFGERAACINDKENLYIPNEFYDREDHTGVTAVDFLYGDEQCDMSDNFVEIISKLKTCQETYDEISRKDEYGYLPIAKEDMEQEIRSVCVWNMKDMEEEKCLNVNDVVKLKHFYMKRIRDYNVYKGRVKESYPELIFHEKAFRYIGKLGKCKDVAGELTRHLAVLNDVGKRLYDHHHKDENAVLSAIQSGYGVICSGKGSKEDMDFNEKISYKGKTYQLTCNPHTKLFEKRTDQRIYFCWGREEIENHKIIIVRIGDHWQE